MKRLQFTKQLVTTVILTGLLVATSQSAWSLTVGDVLTQISQNSYQAYQNTIENMGLGLYGGNDYNQGYRNRDGWAGGGTLGNAETQLYLLDQFASMGLNVTTQGTYNNVVAEMPGSQTPDKIYILGAHYDTYLPGSRPGGDDNASGIKNQRQQY